MDSIVSVAWLAENLHNPKVRIVDCRFALGSPTVGKNAYDAGHIPNAVYFDLEQDLSAPIGKHGGRHPLPDLNVFAEKLGKAGIGNDHLVVAYDDQGGAFASRFWWLLRYMGHTEVAILDGGYSKWVNNGHPVTQALPQIEARQFTPQIHSELLVDMETVKANIGKSEVTIIDSREAKRYLGDEEPIDLVAGHIPSAVNYFWKDALAEDGQWRSVDELRAQFSALSTTDEIIVYCGSGVTACPNFLALERAGYKNIRLYAGSWSDWITYPENPIATGAK